MANLGASLMEDEGSPIPDQPIDLSCPSYEVAVQAVPPVPLTSLRAVTNQMQWILNCYLGQTVLGTHLTSLRGDVFSLCESVSALAADPIATTYPPMAEAVARATERQAQLDLLIAQLLTIN
jgi:hypothetical protein